MNAEQIEALRNKARQNSGDWIGLTEPGDWFAGVVADPAHQQVTTEYGDVEELLVVAPTINGNTTTGTMTFRLSRSVLQKELGTSADKDVPAPGWSVYVTYKGTRRGQSGREYHAYDVAKEPPVGGADAVSVPPKTADSAAPVPATTPVADSDIPF